MKNFDINQNGSNGNMLRDLSLGLLANSGYSQQPKTFGEILAASFADADEKRRAREEQQYKKAQLGLELKKALKTQMGDLPQGYMYDEATGQATKIPGLEGYSPLQGKGGVVEWAYNQSKNDPNFMGFYNKLNFDKANASATGKNQSDLLYSPQISQANVMAKDMGEKKSLLNSMESKMPRLENLTKELSALGQKATYTTSGRVVNAGRNELGLAPTEAAIARAEYISKVDNEILPLLRDTFGAQFTQTEGESLKATLGNPNASPQEKDAILRSFIQTKKEQVLSMRRETGQENIPTGQSINNSSQESDPLGLR